MIKLGVCTGIENAQVVADAGFDYVECNFTQVMSMDEEAFGAWKQMNADAPVKCEAMNCMLPGKFVLTGPGADLGPVKEFLETGMRRAGEIGLDVVVFGSGGARNMPEGFTDKDKAMEQLVEYLHMAGDLAKANGVTIAIEPLRSQECNIVNLVSEGAKLARMANHPAVKLLADGYHMQQMWESELAIVNAGELMYHCHTANPEGRVYPKAGDAWDYAPFFDTLKQIGYAGRVSIEGGTKDLAADAPEAFKVLDALR